VNKAAKATITQPRRAVKREAEDFKAEKERDNLR
jgi:hypothetical protein